MKKFTFLMFVTFACLLQVKAQEPQFVSKEQQNRNVFIEEFTGRQCPYCPLGQVGVNQITAANPGRVYSVNIHAVSSLSPTTFPNLNTNKGAEILNAFNGGGGIPAAMVNRAHDGTVHPAAADCSNLATQQLGQKAEVNVGGQVIINPITRKATITVEAYYTANSASDKNYLTIMMVQDSIMGSQAGGSAYNPDQMIGDEYVHMHTLRDIITATWGDEIAPTTAGSLVTKTYEYQIPETLGSPNGVEVDLDNIHFIAFVAEKKQGTTTRPILNVEELSSMIGTDEPLYPYFKTIEVQNNVSCSKVKDVILELANGGVSEITSLKYEAKVDGVKTQYSWEGNLSSYTTTTFNEELEIPFGKRVVEIKITEVNGSAYEYSQKISVFSDGWTDVYFQGETEEIKIDVVQDKYGKQITWELIDADNKVIASGGPYTTLATNSIKLHRTKVNLSNNDCYKFIIRDEAGNGINCGYGAGYYKISDSKGNTIIDGDGNFGAQAYHNLSTKVGYAAIDETAAETYKVYPNPVKDILTIEGEKLEQINIFNALGQLVKIVNCNDDIVNVNVNDLQNGMYIVNVISNNGEMTSKRVSVLK